MSKTMFEGQNVRLLNALRKVAHDADLRNREGTIRMVDAVPVENACQCGNLLTIEDRGTRCRQCVLAERMYANDSA